VELFEILFILFFILIPIINGISKSRRRPDQEDIKLPEEARPRGASPPGQRQGQSQPDRGYPEPARRESQSEPLDAADLVPDDLWEVLTGERRRRDTSAAPPEPTPEPDPRWEQEWEPEPVGPSDEWTSEPPWHAEELPTSKERFEPAPWIEDSPVMREADLPAELAPRFARYEPESRTARRERIAAQDALAAPRARNVSPLIQTLRRPGGVRQAVVLREILGPPKGLPS
jgi:hypothetical protein